MNIKTGDTVVLLTGKYEEKKDANGKVLTHKVIAVSPKEDSQGFSNGMYRLMGNGNTHPVTLAGCQGKNLEFGDANYHPAIVGEDIILPPSAFPECSVDWYRVGHGMERSDLGSPFGRAGCPERGSLRGSHVPIHVSNHQTEYPLSQPVRLTALPKGEPRAL